MIFTNKYVNFIAFQVSWFVCCYNAGLLPWTGVLIVAAWTSCLLVNNRHWRTDLKIFLVAAFTGYLMDSLLVLCGAISFPAEARIGWPTTLWMVALWINLAATLRYSLSWLLGKLPAAALLGAIGGPVAYYAGYRLDAINLTDLPYSLLLISLEWLLAFPALVWFTMRVSSSHANFSDAALSR